jgi:hypothetical protein
MAFAIIDTQVPTDEGELTIPRAEDLQDSGKAALIVMETLTTVLREVETVRNEQKEMRRSVRDNVLMFGLGAIAASLVFLVILLLIWATQR